MNSQPGTQVQVNQPAYAAGLWSAWHAVGAEARGVSHERSGAPCQDAQAWQLQSGGALLIALADGAGSARYSDQGARCAVETALSALAAALELPAPEEPRAWDALMREAFSTARTALVQLAGAGENPASPREYACTLTCVVATATWVAAGQVGDGAVVAADEAGTLFTITRLQRGEYANETHFLTEEDALEQLVTVSTERPVTGLAVMSDGLVRLALRMPAQEPHPPFFEPLFRFLRSAGDGAEAAAQLAAFLNAERVNARTDDDKSLVLAVRERRPGSPPATGAPAAAAEQSAPERDAA